MFRTMLLWLATSERVARFVARNAFVRRCARRFIAGESADEAFAVVNHLNKEGIAATINFLGEHVTSEIGARNTFLTYLDLLDRIAGERLDANVSVKLSRLGSQIDPRLCRGLFNVLVRYAQFHGSLVRVDMESSAELQQTLDILKETREHCPAVGGVMQAYLYRSECDMIQLLDRHCRVRLCKGAYKEPPRIAYQRKADVDDNFIHLMQVLLKSGVYHGIATHDPKMIGATIAFAAAAGISKDQFEFQMLYGIRRDLQKELVQKGYHVRVYVPYGQEWFPYFMRRLAERPANLWFFLRNIFHA